MAQQREYWRSFAVFVLPPDTPNLDAIAQVLSDERSEPVETRSYCSALRMTAVGWPHSVWSGAVPRSPVVR